MTIFKDSKFDFLQRDIYTGVLKPQGFTTTERDALQNPQVGWLLLNSDTGLLNYYTGSSWIDVNMEDGDWTPVNAFSANWSSTVEVKALAGGSIAVMRGTVTSLVDNNNDPAITFPDGFRPDAGFSKPVVIHKANSSSHVTRGQVTWSGGGTSLAYPDIRVKTGMKVFACYHTLPSEGGVLGARVTSNGNITFYQSVANTSNDAVIDYHVTTGTGVQICDLGTSTGIAGIGPEMFTNDYIYMNIVYQI